MRRGDDVALAGRDVDEPADLAALRGDHGDLSVVGLDGVERARGFDHAVPGAVRLEVVRLRIRDRVGLLERAQVGDHSQRPVAVDPDDAVRKVPDAVRAARSGEDRVERVADERDVGDAADETSLSRRLVWLEGRLSTTVVRTPLRSILEIPRRSGCPVYGPIGGTTCSHSSDGRVRAARAALGDVEVAVGTELEPSRVVQPRGEDGHRRRLASRQCDRGREGADRATVAKRQASADAG